MEFSGDTIFPQKIQGFSNSPFPIAVTINDREPFVTAISFHCTDNTFHVRVCCRAGGQCS